jgi:ribosomal 50S subunit-recycling heat shock protein
MVMAALPSWNKEQTAPLLTFESNHLRGALLSISMAKVVALIWLQFILISFTSLNAVEALMPSRGKLGIVSKLRKQNSVTEVYTQVPRKRDDGSPRSSSSTVSRQKAQQSGGPERANKSSKGSRGTATSGKNSNAVKVEVDGFRLNKCLQGLSRRGADEAILEQRVTINGRIAKPGERVNKGDIVRLDGQMQHWQGVAQAKKVIYPPIYLLDEINFLSVC